MIEGIRQIHAAYPDFHIVMNETVFAKDVALCQWRVTGSATKEDGSTRSIEISGATMMRSVDRQITEEWVYFDTAQFANQLGVAEMPHAQ